MKIQKAPGRDGISGKPGPVHDIARLALDLTPGQAIDLGTKRLLAASYAIAFGRAWLGRTFFTYAANGHFWLSERETTANGKDRK